MQEFQLPAIHDLFAMRIISKFRDYYDSAAAFGHDQHTTYVRELVEFAGSLREIPKNQAIRDAGLLEFVKGCLELAVASFELGGRYQGHNISLSVKSGFVWFAGKLYPFAQVDTTNLRLAFPGQDEHTHFVYSLDKLEAVAREYGASEALENKLRRKVPSWRLDSLEKTSHLREFFALKGSAKFEAMAYERQIPTAVFVVEDYKFLKVAPALKDYHFYAVLDAWQAYQELDMFLGNLAAPENRTVNISDKDRIAQHGFDKWSFRKPPAVS